jgi:hypothetical protein
MNSLKRKVSNQGTNFKEQNFYWKVIVAHLFPWKPEAYYPIHRGPSFNSNLSQFIPLAILAYSIRVRSTLMET